jgi:hypothetical protein
MSPGRQLLLTGWAALLAHHGTEIEYFPVCGQGQSVKLLALVSKPADIAPFAAANKGVSYVLFVDQDAAQFTKDSCVIMDGITYRILDIERQPAAISTRLEIGLLKISGRR